MAIAGRCATCRGARRWRSTAGSTGCGPASTRSRVRSPRLAAELFDTGANMGPAVAATFLQRALTALNRSGRDYPDLVPDGRIGATTLAALDAFLKVRGKVERARPC